MRVKRRFCVANPGSEVVPLYRSDCHSRDDVTFSCGRSSGTLKSFSSIMNFRISAALVFSAVCFVPSLSCARLGETEAQAQARYGEPAPQYAAPTDKPLLPGAKEVIYFFQGWRIRSAFVGGTTARIEYVHLPEGAGVAPVSEAEAKVILDAEKGKYSWREQKPKTGYKELNALKTLFEGRVWERSDHALATIKANVVMVIESRDADALEKKLAKEQGKTKPETVPVSPPPKF